MHRLHAAISGYSQALLDCGMISAARKNVLIAEADAELGRTGGTLRLVA